MPPQGLVHLGVLSRGSVLCVKGWLLVPTGSSLCSPSGEH